MSVDWIFFNKQTNKHIKKNSTINIIYEKSGIYFTVCLIFVLVTQKWKKFVIRIRFKKKGSCSLKKTFRLYSSHET